MSVTPLRDYVVVSKNEGPKQTSSGLYIPVVDEKMVTGTVMAVGSGMLTSDGKTVPLEVKVGDTVAFNKNLAVELKVKDETYLLIREEQLLCVIKS